MSTPERLGKYQIVRVIGRGAMGIVYEGFDPNIERTVAIKTVRMDELEPEEAEEHSQRFRVEAKAAGKLNHPNIVAIYDYGEEQNLSYIVMEYVKGQELKSYFDSGQRFPINQLVRIMGELLDALAYSHARGVVHRDIKPANIFITEDGTVKLGDFGIARIDTSHRTHAGTILGTPSYMSPEQIKGESADQRSDLYSAGVILYQFLTGEKPFSGSMVAVMHKVLNEAPPPPSSLNPQVTAQLEQVVAKAMAKQPDARYANAREFANALRAAVGYGSDEDADATRIIRVKDVPGATPRTPPSDRTGATLTGTDRTATGTRDSTLAESEIEIEFWRTIKDSNDIDNFEIYLRKYPNGHYAELAQLKITKLGRSAGSTLDSTAAGMQTKGGGRTTAEATATGNRSLDDIRRKAEEARRKAEEEMRQAEEELRRAEEAHQKAREDAEAKYAQYAAETLTLQEANDRLISDARQAIQTDAIAHPQNDTIREIEARLSQAHQLRKNLQALLATRDLLASDALTQVETHLQTCDTAVNALQSLLQDAHAARRKILDELQRQTTTIVNATHEAVQALRGAEKKLESACQPNADPSLLDSARAAASHAQGMAQQVKPKIEDLHRQKDLLTSESQTQLETARIAADEAVRRAGEALERIAAEAKRKADEAEAKRKADEAEAKRKADEAEAKRKADEAEAKRKADEAEAKRKADEAEAKRKADEAEAKRKADEAEAKRKADEAEAKRKADEAEAKRKADEAEAKRKADEAEAKRKADEAEAKRKADEAEAKRKADEVEAKRKADEAEAKRKADEAEAKRKADEAEAKRKADEAEAKRKADEAEAKRKADEAEAKRKADEAEAKRKADEASSDATVFAPARQGQPDSDATVFSPSPTTPPTRPEPAVTPQPSVSEPVTSKKLPIIPIGIGVIAVVGALGWLLMRPSEPEAPAPTTPPAATQVEKAPSAETRQADQAAESARLQAEEEQRKVAAAQQAAEMAKRKLEEAKSITDKTQAEAMRKQLEAELRKAEEEKRKAEETRKAAEAEAKRKAAEAEAQRRAAEAETQRKAAAEVEAKRKAAEAEAQRKAAEAEAQRKAAEAEAQRKAAEAEAQRKAAEDATPKASPGDLYQQARALEDSGRVGDAVRLYKQAGNAGHGPSSKRLGEIYLKGAKGVARDYAESVKWYNKARQQGMDIPTN